MGPLCRIEIFDPWVPALKGLDLYQQVEVIYWLHQSRRDLVLQSPASDANTRGTFSLRSPVRPNPLGTSIAKFVGIEGATVVVRGLDCPRRHAAGRSEAGSLCVHPDRAAAAGRFSGRRHLRPRSHSRCAESAGSTKCSTMRFTAGSAITSNGSAIVHEASHAASHRIR